VVRALVRLYLLRLSGTTLNELLECLKATAVAFRKKKAGQKLVVIVEDPTGSMDFDKEGNPISAGLDRLASYLVDFHNVGHISVIYTISDVRAEKVLRNGLIPCFLF
jgi:hypothetical protein